MSNDSYTAFLGSRHLGTGPLADVLAAVYPHRDGTPMPLVFDASGHQIDFDWRGSLAEVVRRAAPPGEILPSHVFSTNKRGPGRPKLGVKSVEVTLLPRHWDWLDRQPARASGTLRRLVDEAMARAASDPKQRAYALGGILTAVAGNEAGFEEATRALYALDAAGLARLTDRWPGDLPAFVRGWFA